MKIHARLLLIGALLATLSPAADARRIPRPAARSTTRSAPARRPPNRVMRFLLSPFQRARAVRSPRADIDSQAQNMEWSILRNATPPFAVVAMSPTATMRQTRQSNYKQGVTARFEVSGLNGGSLPITALLPVSGHVGQAEAARYARTNVYNVEVEYADGTRETVKVNATGYVTEKALDLKLKKGTNYVRFHAEGSAGVGGFRSGREIELEYDGN